MIIRPLIFASLESELAEARGVPVRFVSVAFLAIVAVAVAECAQIVGVLLVFTLMVGPAAAAQNFSRRLIGGVALAAGLALAEAWGGLTLAYYTDWPTSFWITALSGARLSREPRRPIPQAMKRLSALRPAVTARAGGKGGFEPPFSSPSSAWLREIEREIPAEFRRPWLSRLRRLAARSWRHREGPLTLAAVSSIKFSLTPGWTTTTLRF